MAKQHSDGGERKVLKFTSKIRMVPIKLMRRPDFLQKEFKESRADRIADNFDLNGLGRIVVNFRDGHYFIIDGCHRHYALVKNDFGEYDIECEVYDNLTDAEMAEVFLLHAGRRVMSAYETFSVQCEAGDSRTCDVRRIVENNGAKISRNHEVGCVSAVTSLAKVYDTAGGIVLGQVVRTINRAFGGDPVAFDGQLIQGLGHAFNRYNSQINEKELVTRLAALPHGVRGVLRRAEAQRERTGSQKSQCVAATLVDIYNKGVGPRGKDRLPSWWKEAE